jgi:hypothetical protein
MHFSELEQLHLTIISCMIKTVLRLKVRFAAHLNSLWRLMKAIPKLIMLAQFLTLLTIASAIGSLHHYSTKQIY